MKLVEKRVRLFFREKGVLAEISLFPESGTLVDLIEENRVFDGYILDVDMPEYTGMDIIAMLQRFRDRKNVILLTGYTSYAVAACGPGVLGYVLKSQMDVKLPEALERLVIEMDRVRKERNYIISNKRRYQVIRQQDILYVLKEKKNALIFYRQGGDKTLKAVDRITLQQLIERLDNREMMLLDRGIIINLLHIRSIMSCEIEMDDGYRVSSSSKNVTELRKRLNRYWREQE